jgi:pyridoxal phosphate-dependent enzyme|nr:pyridoxal-5'-phosphate-dependent protein [uncultured Campylobacter sp.]
MAAKKFTTESINVHSLLELEIATIRRYFNRAKDVSAVSLIYFRLPKNAQEYGDIFEKILRSTDAVVKEKEYYVAILYATDKIGARKILSDIQEFLGEKPIDTIVSFPQDGTDAATLITKFQDEIKDNYGVLLSCLKVDNFPIFED